MPYHRLPTTGRTITLARDISILLPPSEYQDLPYLTAVSQVCPPYVPASGLRRLVVVQATVSYLLEKVLEMVLVVGNKKARNLDIDCGMGGD